MKLSSNTDDAGVLSFLETKLEFDSLLLVYYPRDLVSRGTFQRKESHTMLPPDVEVRGGGSRNIGKLMSAGVTFFPFLMLLMLRGFGDVGGSMANDGSEKVTGEGLLQHEARVIYIPLESKASGYTLDNGRGYQSSGPSHRKPWLCRQQEKGWLRALTNLVFATMLNKAITDTN